jgi:RHS repeat-associated protein
VWGLDGGLIDPGDGSDIGIDDPDGPGFHKPTPEYTTWTEREYVYTPHGVDEFILQIDRHGRPIYVLQDANLDVVALVDGDGQLLRQYTWSPYGEMIATESFGPHADNRIGHHGMFFDRLTATAQGPTLLPGGEGLYHYRNRTYSPTLGRFLQRDPNGTSQPLYNDLNHDKCTNCNRCAHCDESICCESAVKAANYDVFTQYADGMNLYEFVASNPVTQRDPFGLFILGSYADLLAGTAEGVSIDAASATQAGLGWGFALEVLTSIAAVYVAFDIILDIVTLDIGGSGGKNKWVCTIKPRGVCPQQCQSVFRGFGPDRHTAESAAREQCYGAGCNTPGGSPYNCQCGHVTCWKMP